MKLNPLLLSIGLLGSSVMFSSAAQAGAKIVVDDTKWISIGAGLRTSFSAVEDSAGASGDDYSSDFAVESMRIYINGQIHKYLKMEFNTECLGTSPGDCTNDPDIEILDAIAKFEFMPEFNVWAGRMLTPADRIEMNGPYYGLTWNQYTVPLLPSDQLGQAGLYGRDEGVTVWGTLGKFQYAVGIFDGLEGGANVDDNFLYAARFAYNFLTMESNPAYYTSSTYYGKGGDIFTVGLSMQYQSDGTGIATSAGDFSAYIVDALFEKPLDGGGVITLEGEYKVFDADNSAAALASTNCFCLFDGDSYFVTAAYLFPQEIGIGKFQPYVRWNENSPDAGADSDLLEIGMNYVISGHNARLNFNWRTGDANLTGAPGADVDAFLVGVQFQL